MKMIFAADTSFFYFKEKGSAESAKKAMAAPTACFREADISVLNLESCFGDITAYEPIVKSGPNQISDVSFLSYVEELAPSAVCLANNHSGDFGEKPLFETIELLEKRGYKTFGAGKNLDEAYRPLYFERDGVRVALIGVCENEFGTATRESAGSAGYSLGRVTRAIRDVRRENALPIVFFHGGNERNPFPSPMKVELYRHFVDVGAAAVIAMHTHCPQAYEIYEDAPIVYSMGNFFFPNDNKFLSWHYGYMTELDVSNDSISIKAIPYKHDFNGVFLLEGEEKTFFFKYLDAITRPLSDEKKISDYFDTWCMVQKWIRDPLTTEFGHNTKSASARNRLSCEAHNELYARMWRITFEEKTELAAERIPMFLALQQMEIPEELA